MSSESAIVHRAICYIEWIYYMKVFSSIRTGGRHSDGRGTERARDGLAEYGNLSESRTHEKPLNRQRTGLVSIRFSVT